MSFNTAEKNRIRRAVARLFADKVDPLAEREALKAQIERNRVGDVVNVARWGRDCDLCESSCVEQWPVNVMAFEREIWRMGEAAEGPETFDIISADEAARFEPTFRDRAAEMMGY